MERRILLVDDEPLVLEALRRQVLRRYPVVAATSGQEGLALLERSGPFAVVVSDMRMPGMDGAAFLEQVRAQSPDSVRMILSGQAELESTIAAVNLGRIYRFLTKPCKGSELIGAVEAGIEQYELVVARRELLEKTLHGTVEMLAEILALTNPAAQQRAGRVTRLATELCAVLEIPMEWELRIAAMLSQIGCITLPEEILARLHAGQSLSEEAQSIFRSHPVVAGKLLAGIPRLEVVAAIVAAQLEVPDFAGQPADFGSWELGARGAAILKICNDLDELLVTGASRERAAEAVARSMPELPEALARAMTKLPVRREKAETALVGISQLRVGMVLDEDVMSKDGTRLLPRGHEVTRPIILRLQVVSAGVGIVQPFRVRS